MIFHFSKYIHITENINYKINNSPLLKHKEKHVDIMIKDACTHKLLINYMIIKYAGSVKTICLSKI